MIVLFQQVKNEVDDYLRLFKQIDNPIYVSLFVITIIFIIIYFFIRKVLIPKEKVHKTEKEELEFKNTQLLALFSELNPDPLLRLDHNGIITNINTSAKQLNDSGKIIGKHIHSIIPQLNLTPELLRSTCFQGVFNINGRIYSSYVKLIPEMILLFLRDITEEREYQVKLRESADRAQQLLEQERQRIAYELHDDVGQNLSVANLILMKSIKGNGIEENNKLKNILDNVIKTVRSISYNLKPRILDEMGLVPAIRTLCTGVTQNGGLKVTTDIVGNVYRFPASIETSLYRMCQEAVNNVIKHAKATECNIRVQYSPSKIMIIISDNGVGMDLKILEHKNLNSLGIFNMKNRIQSLGGKFQIDTAPGQGTMLFIDVPFDGVKNAK